MTCPKGLAGIWSEVWLQSLSVPHHWTSPTPALLTQLRETLWGPQSRAQVTNYAWNCEFQLWVGKGLTTEQGGGIDSALTQSPFNSWRSDSPEATTTTITVSLVHCEYAVELERAWIPTSPRESAASKGTTSMVQTFIRHLAEMSQLKHFNSSTRPYKTELPASGMF